MKTPMQEFFIVLKEFNKELYNVMEKEEILESAIEKEKEIIFGFANYYESGLLNIERAEKSMEEHYNEYILKINQNKKLEI